MNERSADTRRKKNEQATHSRGPAGDSTGVGGSAGASNEGKKSAWILRVVKHANSDGGLFQFPSFSWSIRATTNFYGGTIAGVQTLKQRGTGY